MMWPRLRSVLRAARIECGNQPVASTSSSKVAPLRPADQPQHTNELALAPPNHRRWDGPRSVSARLLGMGAPPIADPRTSKGCLGPRTSAFALTASRPCGVRTRATRPLARSRRQFGIFLVAFASRRYPCLRSGRSARLSARPRSFGGGTAAPSLRSAAALRIRSCDLVIRGMGSPPLGCGSRRYHHPKPRRSPCVRGSGDLKLRGQRPGVPRLQTCPNSAPLSAESQSSFSKMEPGYPPPSSSRKE